MESLHVMRLRGAERERAAALPFAVLAVGSIEYHGAHGPFGTDTMVADGFAERLAERRPCLVFPPVAQVVGRGQAPAGFAGYHGRISAIDLDRGRSLVDEVTDGLVRLVDDWVAWVDAVGSEDATD